MGRFVAFTFALVFVGACTSNNHGGQVVNLPVIRSKTPTGLRIVVLPDSSDDVVHVDVRSVVGAQSDPPGKEGLANLVALLRVNSYPRRGKSATQPQSPTTHRQGDSYAYTTWHSSHVRRTVPRRDLQRALIDEERRMRMGCFFYSDEHIEEQKKRLVARVRAHAAAEESKSRTDLVRRAFPEDHPYRRPVEGTPNSIASISREDVCTFLRRYGTHKNTILLLSGKVDHESLASLLPTIFKHDTRRAAHRPPVARPRLRAGVELQEVEQDNPRTSIEILWRLPPHFSEAYDDATLLLAAMGSVMPAALPLEGGCTLDSLEELGGRRAPVLRATLKLRAGAAAGLCLEALWTGMARLTALTRTDDAEFRRTSNGIAQQNFVERMEDSSRRADFVADAFQFDPRTSFDGEDNPLYQHLERIEAVRANDVERAIYELTQQEQPLILIRRGIRTVDFWKRDAQIKSLALSLPPLLDKLGTQTRMTTDTALCTRIGAEAADVCSHARFMRAQWKRRLRKDKGALQALISAESLCARAKNGQARCQELWSAPPRSQEPLICPPEAGRPR